MKRFLCSLLILSVFFLSMGISNADQVFIPAGTVIPVTLNGTANSDKLYSGDMVPITVFEDVYVDGVKVFKAGSSGVANVEKVVRSGGHGRAGMIAVNEARIRDIDNINHRVQLNIESKGENRRPSAITLSVIGVLLILIPFGIWREGTPAIVSGNAVFNAMTIIGTEKL